MAKPAGVDWRDCGSSNLARAAWWEEFGTGILAIEFHGGRVYEYVGVPEAVFRALMDAPSRGKYHAAHIKWNYNWR